MLKCHIFGINAMNLIRFQLVCEDSTLKMVEIKGFNEFKYHTFVLSKILRIYQIASQDEINVFYRSFAPYCVLIILSIYVITGSVFVYQNISDITFALRACIFIIGVIQAMFMFYFYGTNATQIKIVHFRLKKIIQEAAKSKH